ncbi:hypothetical protein DFH06DRAFT_1223794, partial [Mycena polygramma]
MSASLSLLRAPSDVGTHICKTSPRKLEPPSTLPTSVESYVRQVSYHCMPGQIQDCLKHLRNTSSNRTYSPLAFLPIMQIHGCCKLYLKFRQILGYLVVLPQMSCLDISCHPQVLESFPLRLDFQFKTRLNASTSSSPSECIGKSRLFYHSFAATGGFSGLRHYYTCL